MKKYISIILLAVTGILFSCKKDKAADQPQGKDYAELIKYKTWWGMLVNKGETAQYYSVYFNADGSLIWSQRDGDFSGTWSINNKRLSIKFVTPAVQITA